MIKNEYIDYVAYQICKGSGANPDNDVECDLRVVSTDPENRAGGRMSNAWTGQLVQAKMWQTFRNAALGSILGVRAVLMAPAELRQDAPDSME